MPLPSVPPMIPSRAADPKTIYLMWRAGNTRRGRSADVGLVRLLAGARSGGDDGGADLAKLPHLLGRQHIEQRPAYLTPVPRGRGPQRGEAVVGQLRDLAAAAGRAVPPLNPPPLLEPAHRVCQPA